MTCVISSPYCRQQLADAEPAALLGQLPLQRADLTRARTPRRTAATPSTRAGSAAVRCSRTDRDAEVNRRIAFSCTCASNSVEAGRVQPLQHRRRGEPAVEGADGVVGPHRAGDQQPARVEQPRVAQRLEGVEEGDPAAQRVQRRAVDARARAGSSTSAARSRRRRPRPTAGRRCSGRRPASRRRRPAAARPRRAPPARRAARARSAGAARRGRARSRRRRRPRGAATGSGGRAGRCRGTGSSPRARSGRGSRRRAPRSPAPRSAPATAPRPAPAPRPASPSPRGG